MRGRGGRRLAVGKWAGQGWGPRGCAVGIRAAGLWHSENSTVFYLIPSTRYYLHKRKGSA